MDLRLLESLLYQEESETLDFKSAQYPFDHATDEQKSELLKDLLAFANSWRQTEAHILIGVREVRGGRSLVCGITQHLLNQNLQQFVHSRTNRPLIFSYAPVSFEGAQIGVITVPLQNRPLYLRHAYGKLTANVVYIRRGDTTGETSPDEVARMGSSEVFSQTQPILEFDFVEVEGRHKLGNCVEVSSTVFDIPDEDEIPLYGKGAGTSFAVFSDPFENRNYYRDVSVYLRDFMFVRPIGLAVTNTSTVVAHGVLLSLELGPTAGLCVLDDSAKPEFPSKSQISRIHKPSMPRERRIDVSPLGGAVEVRLEFEAIQPGVTIWSENVFHIGAREAMTVLANAKISAHNLPTPIALDAKITINVSRRRVEVSDIVHGLGHHEG